MARLGNSLLSLSFQASTPVAACRCVGFDGAPVSVQGGEVAGVAEYPAAIGEGYAATAKGTAIVETGGAIPLGAAVISDASGRAIAATPLAVATGAVAVTSAAANGRILTGAGTPDHILGNALEAATAAGAFIEILLR